MVRWCCLLCTFVSRALRALAAGVGGEVGAWSQTDAAAVLPHAHPGSTPHHVSPAGSTNVCIHRRLPPWRSRCLQEQPAAKPPGLTDDEEHLKAAGGSAAFHIRLGPDRCSPSGKCCQSEGGPREDGADGSKIKVGERGREGEDKCWCPDTNSGGRGAK